MAEYQIGPANFYVKSPTQILKKRLCHSFSTDTKPPTVRLGLQRMQCLLLCTEHPKIDQEKCHIEANAVCTQYTYVHNRQKVCHVFITPTAIKDTICEMDKPGLTYEQVTSCHSYTQLYNTQLLGHGFNVLTFNLQTKTV